MDSPVTPSLIRERIANACDRCKARKVKCDGKKPCSFCRKRAPENCRFTPPKRPQRRGRREQAAVAPHPTPPHHQQQPPAPQSPPPSYATAEGPTDTRHTSLDPDSTDNGVASSSHGGGASNTAHRPSSAASVRQTAVNMQAAMDGAEDDTEVPREARLLCDAEGKLIFIGDCAPLSLFQSIRQLVTSRVGPDAFAPETSRYSVLENTSAHTSMPSLISSHRLPEVRPVHVTAAAANYILVTRGLVDLFDENRLVEDLLLWANAERKPHTLTSIINYLIIAIGRQKDDERSAQAYFEYAQDQAWKNLSGNLGVGTIQVFVLITIYMLCSCQINSAFLVFGVAVRAAYSIGIHRTEVNARFGPEIHRQRDRLWKSLRIVDLYLSASMGRPPATSDVDCTVPYKAIGSDGSEEFDLLNASVQILLITESIVTEIYSRKKISLQLTEGISHQLRDWSGKWLQRLKYTLAQSGDDNNKADMVGACLVLSSYYYSVMLVSRPFLMYELVRRLSDNPTHSTISGKSKLADACIDAASLMVDGILDLIDQHILDGHVPLLVSWLFAASLVLGVGLLGGFGRILEKYTKMSIRALDHFSQLDTHANQYSLIAQSLLTTALEHLEKRELQERVRRTESSSQLFGLIPSEPGGALGVGRSPIRPGMLSSQMHGGPATPLSSRQRESTEAYSQQVSSIQAMDSPRFGSLDSASLGLGDPLMPSQEGMFWTSYLQGQDGDPSGSALNLFPLLEAGGGIDLTHHF